MIPATIPALPSETREPSNGSRRRKRSEFVTGKQAKNLLEALEFARQMRLRLNVSVDIFWLMFLKSTDDRTRIARCQERLSKWCKRHDFPLTWIWVREIGNHGGSHVHILMHVPPWLMESGEFQSALERVLEPEGGPSHEQAINYEPAYDPLGKLRYMLKGLPPKDGKQLGVRTKPQGEIEGKRCGTTENIGASARRKRLARAADPESKLGRKEPPLQSA